MDNLKINNILGGLNVLIFKRDEEDIDRLIDDIFDSSDKNRGER